MLSSSTHIPPDSFFKLLLAKYALGSNPIFPLFCGEEDTLWEEWAKGSDPRE